MSAVQSCMPPVPECNGGLCALEDTILYWRRVAYLIAFAGMLVLVAHGGSRMLAAAAIFGVASLAGKWMDHGRLLGILGIDLGVTVSVWWLFGPVAGFVVATFGVLAIGMILLDTVRARWLWLAATATVPAQVALHFIDRIISLPLFHPAAPIPVSEFLIGALLQFALLGAFGSLLLKLGSMLRDGQEALEAERDRQAELNLLKDRFIATVSHELRTPLTALRGFTTMLRTERLDDEERNEFLEIMQGQTEELSALIEDLITFSRVAAGRLQLHPERVNIHREIDRVIQGMGQRAEIVRNLSAFNLDGLVDPMRLRQVLRNLIDNAVKYGRAPISVTGSRRGRCLVLEVWDAGEGIPETALEEIFQPYTRLVDDATMSQPGIGLGLPLVKRIVEAHEGQIGFVRDEGRVGFRLEIPMQSTPVPALQPA